MKFYAYVGTKPLGQESVGTSGKTLFELKTIADAHRRAKSVFKSRSYRLYRYTNFYDDKTFREV
jgi:hypothetical protein